MTHRRNRPTTVGRGVDVRLADCQAKIVCDPSMDIDGDSYRMRAHRARSENLRKGVTARAEK